MNTIDQLFSDDPAQFAASYAALSADVCKRIDPQQAADVIAQLQRAYGRDSQVFVIGNGGSAATASHFFVDLAKKSRAVGKRPFRALSLTDNVPYLTAIGNDESYSRIFTSQLESLMRKEDVLIAISASGNSPNLVDAVRYANDHGGVSVAFVGFDGGALRAMAHHVLHVPTMRGEYGPVEDAHSVAMHLVTNYLERWLQRS